MFMMLMILVINMILSELDAAYALAQLNKTEKFYKKKKRDSKTL
jgi:dTDP-4-amino-4,6-dideoxygalactose transaminase